MKHLEAGLIIGGAWAVIVILVSAIVMVLNTLVGTAFAMAIVATTIIVIAGASFIDWYTERRKS